MAKRFNFIFPASKQEMKRECLEILNKGEQHPEKKGILWKRGGGHYSKGYQMRFFILSLEKGQKLYYYKEDGAGWMDKSPRGFIDLSHYKVTDDREETRPHSFQLVSNDPEANDKRNWYLCARSEEEKKSWVSVIQQILNKTYNPEFQQANERFEKSLQLPWETIEMEQEPFNRGGIGNLYKAVWNGTTPVAVKLLIGAEHLDKTEREQFYKEIELLSKLRHPNIVWMFGYVWKSAKEIGLVTEYVKGGDLSKYIFDAPPLDKVLKVSLCLSIARAMHYLHTMDIIHRDLKPHNILVEDLKQANIKICDFGLSILNKDVPSEENKIAGSLAYAAPELSNPNHNDKVDVYSFGVIMWEILTQSRAWDKEKSWDIAKKRDAGQRPPMPNSDLKPIVELSWHQNPAQRPTFKTLYTQLEEKKLEFLLQTNLEVSEVSKNTSLKPLDKINRVFGNGDSVSWDIFLSICCPTLNVRIEEFENLKWILAENGFVDKNRWNTLLKWFSPIIIYDGYQGNSTAIQDNKGYTIEDVIDIVKPTWFFGWTDANDAKAILLSKPAGSYLVRFSGEEGKFTLSVAHNVKVVHWRITRENVSKGLSLYYVEGAQYQSIHEILRTYHQKPLVSSTDPNVGHLFLGDACDRNVDLKQLQFEKTNNNSGAY